MNSLYKISFKYLESKLDSCVYYNQLGLNLAKRLHFSRKIPYFFDIIGYVNLYKENYDSAIVCHFEALKLHEKESDPSGMATSYNGIGFVYDLQGNSEKALTYYQKSLRIGEEYKNEGLTANCRKYIGSIYRSRKEYTKAIEYWNEARKYFDNHPPTSPQVALLKDGKLVHLIQRLDIENNDAYTVANKVAGALNEYCKVQEAEK